MNDAEVKSLTGWLEVPLEDVTIKSTSIRLNLTPWQAWQLADKIWGMLENMLKEQRQAAGGE